MKRPNILEKVNALPKSPGVYLFKNEGEEVIYVGKAKSLKDRVSSYFRLSSTVGYKTQALVANVYDLSFVEVQSELEALILEAELIKKYKPKYNISLKDDKSYKFIAVRNVRIDGELLPLVTTARKDFEEKGVLFGPYPEGRTVSFVLRSVRRIIPFRDCSEAKFKKHRKLGSPCLYGHIGLCEAPCTGNISSEKYRDNVASLKKLLSGDSKKVVRTFRSKMEKLSREKDYEGAAYYRDLLKRYEYVTQKFKPPKSYIENPNLIEDIRDRALSDLRNSIPGLLETPTRIECYDVANVSGKSATASMVVATRGRLDSREYRRFKIKLKDTPNDFLMIKETVFRRFGGTGIKGWDLPGLIVVDGGAPQILAALEALRERGVDVVVIGLAKRFDKVYCKVGDGFEEIGVGEEGIKLLQTLRDEAHRFARKYHHLLRLKELRS